MPSLSLFYFRFRSTYFVLASRIVRPGQVYRVSVTIYKSTSPIYVRASLQRNGVELSSAVQTCKERIPEVLLLRVPANAIAGTYKLWVEGNVNKFFGGTAFHNETVLHFEQRSMTIFVTTDKPVYMQGQVVKFRAMPITTDLRAFADAIDIYMIDPRGFIMRRWLSRQSNLGMWCVFAFGIYWWLEICLFSADTFRKVNSSSILGCASLVCVSINRRQLMSSTRLITWTRRDRSDRRQA